MGHHSEVMVDVRLDGCGNASRAPAWLDLLQSLSGLALALFMWIHMLFVSSILISREAMLWVTRLFEGYHLFGRSYPWLVSLAVAVILLLFVLHAALALRKFPAGYRQYQRIHAHRATLQHGDTTLWLVQLYTGFAMFFLASAHLFFMLTHPAEIGPYASADRVWSGGLWPFYLLLLLAVELHGGIGLYRLALKWGWPGGADPGSHRARLQRAKRVITTLFLLLGLLTLATYMKIGYEHRDRVGERYGALLSEQPVARGLPPPHGSVPGASWCG
jgi:fumarate reductase subunit C